MILHLNKLSFPHPKESPQKFEFNWPSSFSEEMFENVDGLRDGPTDAGVTGIPLAHKALGLVVSDKIFSRFPYISLSKTFDPKGGAIFGPRGII